MTERKRSKTKAAEVAHAIRHHLDIELDDDPDLQASFAEALAAIFEQFRDNWDKIFEELEKLRQRIKDAGNEPTYAGAVLSPVSAGTGNGYGTVARLRW